MISQDSTNQGSMLVQVIAGSDETTVSVATGHQEYHLVYTSPGILTDTARRGHRNSLLPAAFLPIPKGSLADCLNDFLVIGLSSASKAQRNKLAFPKILLSAYYMCLEVALEPPWKRQRSRWAPLSCDIQPRAIYCWLAWGSVSDRCRLKLVPKVS